MKTHIELQTMINSLYKYCNNWSLNINLNISKVVVFRQHPRISAYLEWYYGTDKIEIVNEIFKYKSHIQSVF